MKLFDHILRTRPHAHSLHTLSLEFATNRSELGLKGKSQQVKLSSDQGKKLISSKQRFKSEAVTFQSLCYFN